MKKILRHTRNETRKGHIMDELAMQFGVIPFLVEMLIVEDNKVVHELYENMTKREKKFMFDRKNLTLKKTIGVESGIKKKMLKIRAKYHNAENKEIT